MLLVPAEVDGAGSARSSMVKPSEMNDSGATSSFELEGSLRAASSLSSKLKVVVSASGTNFLMDSTKNISVVVIMEMPNTKKKQKLTIPNQPSFILDTVVLEDGVKHVGNGLVSVESLDTKHFLDLKTKFTYKIQ